MLTVVLPIPPSTNGLFRGAGKRRVRSNEYVRWAEAAGWDVRRQIPGQTLRGPVAVEIALRQPRWDCDIDNRIKAPIDLLVSLGVIDDDKNVRKVSAEWADVDGCRVTVRAA